MRTPDEYIDQAIDSIKEIQTNEKPVRFGRTSRKHREAIRVRLDVSLIDLTALVGKLERAFPDPDACSVATELALARENDHMVRVGGEAEDVVQHSLAQESMGLCGEQSARNWLMLDVNDATERRNAFLLNEGLKLSHYDVADQDEILVVASSVAQSRLLQDDGVKYLSETMDPNEAESLLRKIQDIVVRKQLFMAPLRLPRGSEKIRVQEALSTHLLDYLRTTFVRQIIAAVSILHHDAIARRGGNH